ncbi:MAG TPA: outer membrane beta-barrel protein [Draconibacterium sp.]|nr:outer membrane beta-barrel protein [Draconibacterium sp.]
MLQIRVFLLTVLFVILNITVNFAQDGIITISNDTIHCKINRVSGKSIYYTVENGGSKIKSKIVKDQVKSWKIDETELRESFQSFGENQTGKWRISTEGGVGHRIANDKNSKQNYINQGFTEQEVDSYFRQIKTGIKASGQVHYMFWKNFGLGADYQYHHSTGEMKGVFDPGDNYTLLYGKLNDNIFTNYAGLSMYYQRWINPNCKLYYQISMGLTLFREETIVIYTPNLITGKAFGGNTEIGFEYFLRKNIAIALDVDYFQSTISKIKVNNGAGTDEYKLEKEQMEGLSRIDLGLGLKFYW